MSAMPELHEVVSVCSSPDAKTWEIAAPLILKFISAQNYKLIVPDHEVELFKSISPSRYEVVSEKQYVPDWAGLLAKHRPPQRGQGFGWYLQQFVKLAAIAKAPAGSTILIWDADTIPLQKLEFINEMGQLVYYKDHGYHAPYFVTIKKLLGLERQQTASFISQCFVSKSEWMHEMVCDIEAKHQVSWMEATIQCLDIRMGLCFSEYETLGTYIAHHYPKQIQFTDRPWTRDGVQIFGNVNNLLATLSTKQVSNLDYVSFEKSQTNNRTPVQRMLKALRRTVKRVRRLFLTVYKIDAKEQKMLKPLVRVLGRVRDYITFQTTSRAEVAAFLKLVRPYTTDIPLKRFGGDGDGGYLIPDDLKNISICFSPGVSNCSDFELSMANLGMTCFMADYSVSGPAAANQNFHFEKKFLGSTNSAIHTTLFDWIDRNAKMKKDFILQMDIEDSEYEVFDSTPSESLQKFQIMTVEFHRFRRLMNKKGLSQLTRVFTKLLEHFVIVHNHPNNNARVLTYRGLQIPLTTEITFLRKDRITKSWPTMQFPHPLDRPNRSDRPDLPLPDCWYKF